MLDEVQVKALMIRADAVLKIEDAGMTGVQRLGWVLFPTEAVEQASLTVAREKLEQVVSRADVPPMFSPRDAYWPKV